MPDFVHTFKHQWDDSLLLHILRWKNELVMPLALYKSSEAIKLGLRRLSGTTSLPHLPASTQRVGRGKYIHAQSCSHSCPLYAADLSWRSMAEQYCLCLLPAAMSLLYIYVRMGKWSLLDKESTTVLWGAGLFKTFGERQKIGILFHWDIFNFKTVERTSAWLWTYSINYMAL